MNIGYSAYYNKLNKEFFNIQKPEIINEFAIFI